jgi:hypothetical protein
MPVPILGIVIRAVAGVLVTVYTIKSGNIPVFHERYNILVYLSGVSSATTDVWNTTALCWFLGMKRSVLNQSSVVNRVIIWAIGRLSAYRDESAADIHHAETGLITSITAVLMVVFVGVKVSSPFSSHILNSGLPCQAPHYGWQP